MFSEIQNLDLVFSAQMFENFVISFCTSPDILSVLIFTHRELVTANPYIINSEGA